MAKKTIVMPVGEHRGKKKSMDAAAADSIIKVFGTYDENEAAANAGDTKELEASLADALARAEAAETKVSDLETQVEELTDPDGEGGGDE